MPAVILTGTYLLQKKIYSSVLTCEQGEIYIMLISLGFNAKSFPIAIAFFPLFFPKVNLDGLTKVTCRIFYIC